jgi:hypothetical protein
LWVACGCGLALLQFQTLVAKLLWVPETADEVCTITNQGHKACRKRATGGSCWTLNKVQYIIQGSVAVITHDMPCISSLKVFAASCCVQKIAIDLKLCLIDLVAGFASVDTLNEQITSWAVSEATAAASWPTGLPQPWHRQSATGQGSRKPWRAASGTYAQPANRVLQQQVLQPLFTVIASGQHIRHLLQF